MCLRRRGGSTRPVACSARITGGPLMGAARASGSHRPRARGLRRELLDRRDLARSNSPHLSRRVCCLCGPMRTGGRRRLPPIPPCMLRFRTRKKIQSLI